MANSFKQDNLIGQSNALLEVLEHISQIAPLSKPVLIIGERGTGKELIAERLHYLSKRWEQNFIKLNCGALSESLLESELFGHDSGAFTGANKKHQGRFERADNGTLFLDELANTSALVQEKLLRVIEYGEFERVGGSQTIQADVRLICAANEDLPTLADAGEFRADLLDRLAFDVITLPPLRHRADDIMPLAEHFAINMAKLLEQSLFTGFTPRALKQLMDYTWPGNIRELKNVIERSVYRHGDSPSAIDNIVIDPFDSPYRPKKRIRNVSTAHENSRLSEDAPQTPISVPPSMEKSATPPLLNPLSFPTDFKKLSEDYETQVLQQALKAGQFNQKKTAELLNLSYHQLRGILKKYNLLDK